jgi:16S rRNA (cytosine967-C5)-methyltransferase
LAPAEAKAGLRLRQRSAARLADVLAGGEFNPFSATEIADGRDRSLANRLVTTALRHHGHINAAMGRLLERGPPKRAGSFESTLRLGLAQLLYMPEQGEHSAIDLAVESIKSDPKARHFAPLMNAALRRAQTDAEALRALPREMLLPRPLQEGWAAAWGADAVDSAIDNLLAGAALDLTLRDDDDALVAELNAHRVIGDTVRVEARDKPVNALPGYDAGRWWVQDVAAAIPARLLKLEAGARVLDMCAAPGGKTAQLIKMGYDVTALDDSAVRLARLNENMARLGYTPAIAEADGTTYAPARGFDGVLLDAPCSATGTFRRHPEVLWHRGAQRIRKLIELQRTFISSAVRCLNPAGVLVYCVCSLERGEGEDQLGWVAEACPELVADPIGADELPGLADAVTAGIVRTHPGIQVPGDRKGTLDGFFVARFRKRT